MEVEEGGGGVRREGRKKSAQFGQKKLSEGANKIAGDGCFQ